jgi:hypothetical protein
MKVPDLIARREKSPDRNKFELYLHGSGEVIAIYKDVAYFIEDLKELELDDDSHIDSIWTYLTYNLDPIDLEEINYDLEIVDIRINKSKI